MKLKSENEYETFSELAYGIIANTTRVSEEIYQNQFSHEVFLLFLFNICKNEEYIKYKSKTPVMFLKDTKVK